MTNRVQDTQTEDSSNGDYIDPLDGVYEYLDEDGERHSRDVYNGSTDEKQQNDETQTAIDSALKWLL